MTSNNVFKGTESKWKKTARDFGPFLPGITIILPLLIIALIAPLLPLPNPIQADLNVRNQHPSKEHIFGTDPYGMDVFSRVIYAARLDFLMTLFCVILAVAIGSPIGAIAGYIGGGLDNIVGRTVEVVQSFPIMLFAMMVQIALGNNIINLIVIIGIFISPFYAKLVRSLVKPLRDAEFIQAARVSGQTRPQILFRHLLPNTLAAIISQFTLSATVAIRTLSGLSFLGLGVETPTPEWGSMIQIGASWIVFGKWWSSVFPGLALFLTIWSLAQISEVFETIYSLSED